MVTNGYFKYNETASKDYKQSDDQIVENGVCIMRMQPMHNAHLYIIKSMLRMCENVTVILGSENKVDMLRNPFDIGLREEILMESLTEEESNRVKVVTLADWSTEGDVGGVKHWGLYFYMNVVSRIGSKKFTIFYNDEPEIIEDWFFGEFIREDRVSFFFMERGNMFEGLSATKIRAAFENGDIDYVRKYCTEPVVRRYHELREKWFNVKANPRADFSMV